VGAAVAPLVDGTIAAVAFATMMTIICHRTAVIVVAAIISAIAGIVTVSALIVVDVIVEIAMGTVLKACFVVHS
jgi:hypothetical protein